MSDDDDREEFMRLFREFLQGNGASDFSALAGAAGLPQDPSLVSQMMSQFQAALSASGQSSAAVADERAVAVAAAKQVPITDDERQNTAQAFQIAQLWLSEQTSFADSSIGAGVMNRQEWAHGSLPAWREIADPISTAIGQALVDALSEQAPEEARGMLQGVTGMLQNVGATLFSLQLGQIVGMLSQEVTSATEIGIPLLPSSTAALLPQNVVEFARDLDVPLDQVNIYLALRELAHIGLFKNARWLTLHITTAIREYAQGVTIDTERMRDTVENLDLRDTSALEAAIRGGALLSERSEAQRDALARIETLIALIEGWVDAVVSDASTRLPKADALREALTRRRATGGPAEQAFGALIGLELRPRRLREAAQLWSRIGDALGHTQREELWRHPDTVPTSADMSDPDALIARLQRPAERDELDEDLERLLSGGFDGSASDAAPASDAPETSPEDDGGDTPPAQPES